jgi:hypothetical protein
MQQNLFMDEAEYLGKEMPSPSTEASETPLLKDQFVGN